jgi:hypothetical protein
VGSHAHTIGADSIGSEGNDDNARDEPSGSGRADASQGHHGRYCSARASTKSLCSVGGTITSGGSTGPRTGRSNTRFHPYGKQRATLPTSAVSHTPELESDNTAEQRDGLAAPQDVASPALSQNRSQRPLQTSSSRALAASPALLNTPRSDSANRPRPSAPCSRRLPTRATHVTSYPSPPPPVSQKHGPLLHRASTSSSGDITNTRSSKSVPLLAPAAPHGVRPLGTWLDPPQPPQRSDSHTLIATGDALYVLVPSH